MKMEELQTVNQEEVSRRVRNYWTCQILCIVGMVLVLIIDLRVQSYLNYIDEIYIISPFFWLGAMFISLAGALGLLFLLFVLCRRSTIKIIEIMEEECDPYLYEICWHKTRGRILYKYSHLCNLLLAQYYQGNYEQAWETVNKIDCLKLKGAFKANYYSVKSALCFKRGLGEQVRHLEDEFRVRIGSAADKKNMQILCANNNLQRAYENKDYVAAYGFLEECKYLYGVRNYRKQRVSISFWEARLAFAAGNMEEAKVKAEYTVKYGNRTIMARDAHKMLEEMTADGQTDGREE